MEAQTLKPAQWIVVDDGSTDRTPQILADAMQRIPWLKVVSRGNRGYRKVGGGVIDAFYAGMEAVDVDYDFIAKMDVDLEFSDRYLETAVERFRRDPQLAAISGKVYRPEDGELVEEFIIDEMVAGQFKLYRREAFDDIGGFVREVMWDGIDFHMARLKGWRTRSVDDPAMRIIHLRLMGSSDRSVYRGRLRWGRGQYFMGSSLPYVIASGLFRAKEQPYVLGGLCIIAGYAQAALERAPRFDHPGFQDEVRRWQHARLRRVLKGGGPR